MSVIYIPFNSGLVFLHLVFLAVCLSELQKHHQLIDFYTAAWAAVVMKCECVFTRSEDFCFGL